MKRMTLEGDRDVPVFGHIQAFTNQRMISQLGLKAYLIAAARVQFDVKEAGAVKPLDDRRPAARPESRFMVRVDPPLNPLGAIPHHAIHPL